MDMTGILMLLALYVAYRAYYRGDKARFATWTNRAVPFWWSQNENHHI